jgi:Arc/MetJ-type ribon-helix-helix transcriptional regulator
MTKKEKNMNVTTSFPNILANLMEKLVESGLYTSQQELIRAAVRLLLTMHLENFVLKLDCGEDISSKRGTLLDEIRCKDLDTTKDYRIRVGAKKGTLVKFVYQSSKPKNPIYLTIKTRHYEAIFKHTPWLHIIAGSQDSELSVTRIPHIGKNAWEVSVPPGKNTEDEKVRWLDVDEVISQMQKQGYKNLEFTSLSVFRLNETQNELISIQIFEKMQDNNKR